MSEDNIMTLMYLLSIFTLLAMVGITFYFSKLDDKEYEKRLENHRVKLALEESKPRCYVEFRLQNGDVMRTDAFDPKNSNEGSDYNHLYTSYELASIHNKNCFERGYFKDKDGLTYPLCEVKYSRVVEEKV